MKLFYNLNMNVGVKLTDKGWQHYYAYYQSYTKDSFVQFIQQHKIDEEGYHWMQLHIFISVFGPCFHRLQGDQYMNINLQLEPKGVRDVLDEYIPTLVEPSINKEQP